MSRYSGLLRAVAAFTAFVTLSVLAPVTASAASAAPAASSAPAKAAKAAKSTKAAVASQTAATCAPSAQAKTTRTTRTTRTPQPPQAARSARPTSATASAAHRATSPQHATASQHVPQGLPAPPAASSSAHPSPAVRPDPADSSNSPSVFTDAPGTSPPPSTLGGYQMTAFGPDSRPLGQDVASVQAPAGTLGFSPDLEHDRIGQGWSDWSNGYTGDVYSTSSDTITLTLPPQTVAFAFYAQPSEPGSFTIDATNGDGTSSGEVPVSGTSGAEYFGFYAGDLLLTSITITTGDPGGFAIGEFGISQEEFAPVFNETNAPLIAESGTVYEAVFSAGAYPAASYALTSAPSWLSIDANGNVFGTTPSGISSFSYSVTATNALGSATAGPYTVELEVPLTFTQDSPPLTLRAGSSYSASFTATGFPAPWYALDPGPSWLSIDANGNVTGTPPAGTTCFTYSVAAWNDYGTVVTGPYTVTLQTPPVFTQTDPSLTSLNGQTYSAVFTASGIPTPTYTLASGPSWLTIDQANQSGAVTGTPPSGTTSFSYSVTASNVQGSVTTTPYTVAVQPTTTIAGTVVTGLEVAPVSDAVVQACATGTDACLKVTTAADGSFSVGSPIGQTELTVFPPAGSDTASRSVSLQVPATGTQGETIALNGVNTLPAGSSLGGSSTSPVINWSYPSSYADSGCPNGTAFVTVEGNNEFTGAAQSTVTPLTEDPPGSGDYSGTIPPQYPVHGPATISDQFVCPSSYASGVLPDIGAASDTVLITGSGFTGASAVDFGTVPAGDFTVISDSLIDATVPAGQGDVAVTVSTPTGPAAVDGPAVFGYFGVTGVSPSSGPGSGGTTVTITGAGFTNADAVTFGGAEASSFTVVSDTEIQAVTPAGAGTADVDVDIAGDATPATAAGAFTYAAGSESPARRASVAPAIPKPPVTPLAVHPAAGPATKHVPAVLSAPITGPDVQQFVNQLLGDLGPQIQQLVHDAAQSTVDLVTAALCALPPGLVKTLVKRAIQGAIITALVALAAAAGPAVSGLLRLLIEIPGVGPSAVQAVMKRIGFAAGVTLDTLLDQYIDPLVEEALDHVCHETPPPPPSPNVYIDPSGTVLDTDGNPVSGATVTLLRADTAAGPFTPLDPTGPGIQPAVNPQTTGSDGVFHWDVFSGWYELQASAPGCTDPGDSSQSSATAGPYPVPPPQVGLTITLACADEAPPPTPTVTGLTTGDGPTAGGTSVSVLGTGFTPSSTVDFGTTPATGVTYLSGEELTVTSPPGSGPADVTVANGTSTSATSSVDQFYYGNTPTITGLSQTSGPAAGGTTLTIDGSGFTNADSVSFNGNPAASYTVLSDTQIQATTPANVSGTVDVQVVTPAGVSTTGPPDQYTFTGGAVIDQQVNATGTDTAVANLSTTTPDDLIVAFVSSDGPDSATQKSKVTGGGLTWTLDKRTNSGWGTSEIWTAQATGTLSDAAITSTLAEPGDFGTALTVVAFSHATGIGQSVGASGTTGAPTASLTTSGTDGWVFAVGNDWTASVPRTLGPDQTLLTQSTDARGDTYWVQYQTAAASAAGTSVTINDTAPTDDRWNLTLIEID